MHEHDPQVRLPGQSRETLRFLKDAGWRLGVLTNGVPAVQARKIAALGLCPYVDAVVYAMECGTGAGKPQRQAFHEIASRLGVTPERVVIVGNDERCDVIGAIEAGMRSIRCAVWTPIAKPTAADAVVRRLTNVPKLAQMLIEQGPSRHAA
jgi:putative hydrolase of the HAD superfamily